MDRSVGARGLALVFSGALAALSGSSGAAATERKPTATPLMIVDAPAGDSLLGQAALRTSAELRAAGFDVHRADCPSGVDLPCGQPTPGAATVVAIALRRSGDSVVLEVRLIDRQGNGSVDFDALALRRELDAGRAASLEPATIGVYASELVYACLAEPPAVVAAAAVVARPQRSSMAPFGEVGVAGLVTVAPTLGVEVRAGVVHRQTWALALHAIAARPSTNVLVTPTAPGSTPKGASPQVDVRALQVIAGLELGKSWRPTARLQPQASFGVGISYVQATTTDARAVRPWTPSASLGAGLGFKINDRWAAQFDVQGVVLTQPIDIKLYRSGQEVGVTSSTILLSLVSVAIRATR